MAAPARTRFDDRGLVLADGARVPFFAGAMHYWRVAPARWEACVRAMRELGFRLVETYVPWSVHDGEAWTGARDLRAFLDVVAGAGLHAVLRPGPHCNAELTDFGYPERVLREDACLARGRSGAPVWMPAPPRAFPAPSYASAAFRAHVADWYRVVGEQVADHPAVVAIGVDNEAQMFFRVGAFDHDYHPDAIAWWRDATGDDGPPPRAWDASDAARCVAWVRSKDAYVARALGAFGALLDDAGFGGLARFHNLPPGEPQWFDLPGVARAVGGPAGIDVYAGRDGLADVRRRVLHLAGSSELPLVPELGVGFFPWLPPIDEGAQRDVALTALACGARGFGAYMAVGRERWYGGAITPDGALTPAAKWLGPLLHALDACDWTSLRRHAPIAVIVSRADARFGLASSLLDPVTPVVAEALGLGPGGAAELGRDPAAVSARRWLDAVTRALDLAHLPYALVDEGCAAAQLARHDAVILPTFDRLDAGLLATLRTLDTTIVIGPGTPTRDELDRPLTGALPRAGKMRAGSLDDLPGLAEDLSFLVPTPPWIDARPSVSVSSFGSVLFLSNLTARATRTRTTTPHDLHATDPLTGESFRTHGQVLEVPLAPHAVRVLLVT